MMFRFFCLFAVPFLMFQFTPFGQVELSTKNVARPLEKSQVKAVGFFEVTNAFFDAKIFQVSFKWMVQRVRLD